MARSFLVLGVLLVTVGLWLGWPLIRASTQLTRTRGHVLDVLSTALPDGNVRMAIAYEFPVVVGKSRETVLCYRLADRSFALSDYLDLPAGRAEALSRNLPHQWSWVFYDVNDPAGSAFMVSDHLEPGRLRAEHGVLLLLSGIACWLLAWVSRRRTSGG